MTHIMRSLDNIGALLRIGLKEGLRLCVNHSALSFHLSNEWKNPIVSAALETSPPTTRPPLTLLELPAAAAQARSKYLAQGFLLFVGLVFLVGTFIILRWSSQALEQQSLLWETRLSQAAFADASHISNQFENKYAPWQRLAASDAMKLYILQAMDPSFPDRESARTYVENALTLAAEREGLPAAFAGRGSVPANRSGDAAPAGGPGIVLVGADNSPLMAIGSAVPKAPTGVAAAQLAGGALLYGPYSAGASGDVLLRYEVPIRHVQGEHIIARLHVTYALGPHFLPPRALARLDLDASGFALVHPLNETVLTAHMANGQKRPTLRRAPAFDGDERYRWAASLRQSGATSAQAASGEAMLVAAQALAGTQWVAVRSVEEGYALATVKRQTWIWLLLSFLALGLSCALILYSWRRGVDHRAQAISSARSAANQALAEANSFLTTLADTQPSALLVLDAEDVVTFANAPALRLMGLKDSQALHGQSLASLFGTSSARPLERAAQSARAARQVVTASLQLDGSKEVKNGRVTAALLAQNEGDARVLLSFDDLTDLMRLRQKREAALRQLVAVLTGLIDARDPHSAAQSRSVAALARRVGVALDYTGDLLRDLEMAALLSNAGKILVPRSVLTKPGALSPEELQAVRTAVAKTSDLLDEVDFDGRVAAILAADDADDPDALDQQAANIIRAANALVSMLSPRAHRAALSLDEAVERVKELQGDKRVLAALEHVARNHWQRADEAGALWQLPNTL